MEPKFCNRERKEIFEKENMIGIAVQKNCSELPESQYKTGIE